MLAVAGGTSAAKANGSARSVTCALLRDDLVLVVRAGADAGQEDLPDPGTAKDSHRVDPAVPAVEVPDDPDRPGAGRPHRERRARCPLMHPDLRPEMVPQTLVPALGHQVKVEFAQRGPVPVGIVQDDHHPVGIGRLQTVVRDARTVHHPGERPGGVHAAHLDPLATGQDDHPDRVRAPPADDHPLAAVAIPFRVRRPARGADRGAARAITRSRSAASPTRLKCTAEFMMCFPPCDVGRAWKT